MLHLGGNMLTPEIVLLGGPNSGKTHYAGQLYGRLQRNPGKLKLRTDNSTPPDLSALEAVLQALENGYAADHTSTETWSEIELPLIDELGRHINLLWPDYGGEQLKEVFSNREVQLSWKERLVKSEGWFLLIRLSTETTYPDALENLAKQENREHEQTKRIHKWDGNAYWVELLQILCHVAGISISSMSQKPKLAIMLSCYDESYDKDKKPEDILQEKLPLLSAFIKSNWQTDSATVWGLSSLGKTLNSTSEDDDFIDDGPELQGWIIDPKGGEQNSDLSQPLAWLLDKINE